MILPTKNELKDVNLDTLINYCEMLEEEIVRRKVEEKQKTSAEVAKMLEEALELAKKHEINVFFEDEEQTLHLDDFSEVQSCGSSIIVEFD